MNESIDKNALTLLGERLKHAPAHVSREAKNRRFDADSRRDGVVAKAPSRKRDDRAASREEDQEVDVKVRMKPACPARDLKVVVTLTGPNGAPPCRIGAAGRPERPCNENRRQVFD